MISDDRIRHELENVLKSTDFKEIGERETGKVRDSYKQGNKRIIITTDRISAFDRILGTIPFKGQVLTQLAAFWFKKTKDIARNHLITVPDPNVMIVRECEQLPLEFIVRGYITGVTKTSAWYNYENGVRNLCGNIMPEGLRKDQKLDSVIITPTTKLEEHDRSISREEAIEENLIDKKTFDNAADICFRLFDEGTKYSRGQGLILVDTKYEIGKLNGELIVSDEIHTPDSSRYWFLDSYEELFDAGKDQKKLDKEYIREWLVGQGFRGDSTPPELPDEVRIEVAKCYINAYELITGYDFIIHNEPVLERIEKVVNSF